MMFSRKSGPIRRSFKDIPTLETTRLTMRKILPKDQEDMYEYSRDPETSKYLLWEPHSSPMFTLAHITLLQTCYEKATFFDWALILKENGKMIGTCGFTEIYEKQKKAEIGYVIAPKFHRKGYAPEAIKRVMEYGFETLGLCELSARFMEDNKASEKVLLRLGFSSNTTKNESILKRGKRQQILTYTLKKEDYLKNKKTEE